MSLAAAVGYAFGIMIFALVFRRRRKKVMDESIAKAHSKISNSKKGKSK